MARRRRRTDPEKNSNSEKNSKQIEGGSARGWIVILVLGAAFLAFANSALNGFAYDDRTQILRNELIRDFSNLPTALKTEVWFWRVQQNKDLLSEDKPTTPYYRPAFIVYLMMGWALFQTWAPGWHFASIVLHLFVVYLVFRLFERVTGRLKLAAIASLLFALHPLRSESVAWISGITDPLLAVLIVPAFYFYVLYREGRGRKELAFSVGLFFLATFTKEPAVALPILIACYELFLANQDRPFMERLKPALAYSLLFILVAAIYFFMRYRALGFWLNDPAFARHTPEHVLLTIPLVIWKYIGLLFWPVNLSLYHWTPVVTSPLSFRFILPVIGLAGLAVALYPLRKSPITRFGIMWFAVNLLPVLNLGAFDANFLVQERYLYIPAIGFSLLIAMTLEKLPWERWLPLGRRQLAQTAGVTAICLLLTVKTFAQNSVWKDDLSLYTHGAESAPDQPIAHLVLAYHYIRRADQRPEKLVELLERYMKLEPNDVAVIANLAAARLQLFELTMDRSHIDRSIGLSERGLRLDPSRPELWDTLGHAHTYDTELKNYDRARACFTQALRIEPRMAISSFHMGATYFKQGDYANALLFLETARKQQEDFPDTHLFLGYTYANLRRLQDAANSLSRFLELKPNALDAARHQQELEKIRAQLQQAGKNVEDARRRATTNAQRRPQ